MNQVDNSINTGTVQTSVLSLHKKNIKNYVGLSLAIFASQGFAFTLVNNFFSFVYTEFLGISAAVVGVILSIGIIIDGLSDFGMGIILDRVRTKHGKARPWLLWMAIPLAVSTGLIFFAPTQASATVRVVYCVLIYNIFCTALTGIRIPANSLGILIGDHAKVRMMGSFLVSLCSTVGTAVCGWILQPVVDAFGGGLSGYRALSVIFGVLISVFLFTSFFCVREANHDEAPRRKGLSEDEKKLSIWKQVKYLILNKYWVIQQAGLLGVNFSMGFIYGTVAYFTQYVIGDMSKLGMIFTALSTMIIGTLIALPLTQKFDGRKVALLGCIVTAVGSVIAAAFGTGAPITVLLVGLAVRQIGMGIFTVTDIELSGRVVDYGEWKHGVRQEGMVLSGKSVMQKISSALAAAILGFCLTASGYVGGTGEIAQSSVNVIRALFLYCPAIFSVIAIVFFSFFNLSDKRVLEIQQELQERKAQAED